MGARTPRGSSCQRSYLSAITTAVSCGNQPTTDRSRGGKEGRRTGSSSVSGIGRRLVRFRVTPVLTSYVTTFPREESAPKRNRWVGENVAPCIATLCVRDESGHTNVYAASP